MSKNLLARVAFLADIRDASTFRALVVLASHAAEDGRCWPSFRVIAEEMGCHRDTARRAVGALVEQEWVVVEANEHGGAPGETKRFRIAVERLPEDTESDPEAKGRRGAAVHPVSESDGVQARRRRGANPSETGCKRAPQISHESVMNRKHNNTGTASPRPVDRPEPEDTRMTPHPNAEPLPDWMPRDAWDGFLDLRRQMKAPPTAHAVALLVGKLETLRSEGYDPQAVLEQSIERGWRGLFPVETRGRRDPGNRKADRRTGFAHDILGATSDGHDESTADDEPRDITAEATRLP